MGVPSCILISESGEYVNNGSNPLGEQAWEAGATARPELGEAGRSLSFAWSSRYCLITLSGKPSLKTKSYSPIHGPGQPLRMPPDFPKVRFYFRHPLYRY